MDDGRRCVHRDSEVVVYRLSGEIKEEGKMAERILIVDDEPDMLVLLNMIIKSRTPYEV